MVILNCVVVFGKTPYIRTTPYSLEFAMKLCECGKEALPSRNMCRDCRGERRRLLYFENIDKERAKQKAHYHKNKEAIKKKKAKYRESNREKHRDYYKSADAKRRKNGYFKSDKYREINKIYAREWRKKNKERVNAVAQVHYAVGVGKLIRPTKCNCGSTDRIEAHHEDYSKPLVVIWLCRKCHLALHGKKLH